MNFKKNASKVNRFRIAIIKILNIAGKILSIYFLFALPAWLFSAMQPKKIDLVMMVIVTIDYFWNYFGKED